MIPPSAVTQIKRKTVVFDPTNPAWRHRLWVRLDTPSGSRVYILWRRVLPLLAMLAVAGWLALAGGAWAFLKYRRGAAEVRFVDVAFIPFRYDAFKRAMSRHYFTVGRKQIAAGAWSGGILSLRQAVAKDPHNVEARLALAEIFSEVQRRDLALNLLREGLPDGREDVDYVEAIFGLLGDPTDAPRRAEIARQLLPAAPDQSRLHIDIARRLVHAEIELGDYAAARRLAESWFPEGTTDRVLLTATIDEATGYPDLAIVSLQAAAEQRPDDERLSLLLIQVYQRSHRLSEARRVATLRALRHPDSPGAACDLVALLYETGESASADRELTDYLDRFHDDPRALLLIAGAGARLKRPDVVRRIVARAPRDADGRPPVSLLFAQITTECAAGDYREALTTAATIEHLPTLNATGQGNLLVLRCWAGYGAGHDAEADAWLDQFLSLSYPTVGRDAIRLAGKLDEVHRPAAARRLLQTQLDRNPDDLPALLAIARHDLAQQDWAALSPRIPQLLALDPVPARLLAQINQRGGDALSLTPDLRERLRNAKP